MMHTTLNTWPIEPIQGEDPSTPKTALTQKKNPYRQNLILP